MYVLPCCADNLATVGRILHNITNHRGSSNGGTGEVHSITKCSILEIELVSRKTCSVNKIVADVFTKSVVM